MKQHILTYYQNELDTSYMIIGLGVLLVLTSAVLTWHYSSEPLQKGIAYILFGSGVLMLVAGILYKIDTTNELNETVYLSSSDHELLQFEMDRMNKVLPGSYQPTLITLSLVIVIGIISIHFGSSEILKGIGIGLLITGTIGHISESISMQKNNHYQQQLQNLNF